MKISTECDFEVALPLLGVTRRRICRKKNGVGGSGFRSPNLRYLKTVMFHVRVTHRVTLSCTEPHRSSIEYAASAVSTVS